MTVKELIELLNDMPEQAIIGTWDGDYSIRNPAPASGIYWDDKRGMVIIDHE